MAARHAWYGKTAIQAIGLSGEHGAGTGPNHLSGRGLLAAV